jgi:flagellar basal body rod protein FlgG
MLYGMYLSATGVITSAYRQDIIANNLANSETTGFKRDLATFSQRPTADQENPLWASQGSRLLDMIGGGTYASPTMVDTTQGITEPTNNPLDAAVMGSGYFTVAGADGQPRLTRAGHFRMDKDGHLTLGTDQANPVLDATGVPITLDPTQTTRINQNGQILQNEQPVAQLGFFDVPQGTALKKDGGSLLAYPTGANLTAATGQVLGGYLEKSNVDPASELSDLMDTQRELEANANMIRYQDETLGELVNTVGKVS